MLSFLDTPDHTEIEHIGSVRSQNLVDTSLGHTTCKLGVESKGGYVSTALYRHKDPETLHFIRGIER